MSRLDDDGGPEVTVIEDPDSQGHAQALSFRVGPVYYDSEPQEVALWVEYQEEHGKSALLGPVLISLGTWTDLQQAVNARFDRYWDRKFREAPLWRRILSGLGLPSLCTLPG